MSTRAATPAGNARTPARRGRHAIWREQHAWAWHVATRRLVAHPVATTLAVVVMGLALSLPLAFALMISNLQTVAHGLGDSRTLSVFLRTDVDAAAARKLAAQWRSDGDVAAVSLRSPQQGAHELATTQGFGEALAALEHNPLPWVALVRPRAHVTPARVDALVARLRGSPQVKLVQDQRQWRSRAHAVLALSARALIALAVLLVLAALLVVGVTVRQDIHARAEQIGILERVGASGRFIRRPYLYVGVLCGLGAGAVAVIVVLVLEGLLAGPAARVVSAYGGLWLASGLNPRLLLLALPACALLGWIGARIGLFGAASAAPS